jgi:signal transduction histidine kinase
MNQVPGLVDGMTSEPRSLVLATVASLDPLEAGQRNVALVLVALSLVVWLLAALVGWRLCKRALLPVTRMAKTAGSMSMADGTARLPIPGTGDELDLLAGSFNGLLDRLHQEFERQKRFTGDASHQLRTPLAALLGQLEVARRRERSVEEYQRVLDEVHGEALRLRQIVESLLFMARAESEAGMPELEPVEMVLWLRERVSCRRRGGERAGDLVERLSTEAPVFVQVQPQLLGQALENLLDNACKYSRPGTLIVVAARQEGGCALLSVEDSGCGIAPEDLPRVFEPFFRSAQSVGERVAGFGLGLAVVRGIAAAFGGTVTVASELGAGSRFELRLPLTERPDDRDAVPGRGHPVALEAVLGR